MDIADELRCLFSATVEQQDGRYVVEVPDRELELGSVEADSTYRVALLSAGTAAEANTATTDTTEIPERQAPSSEATRGHDRDPTRPTPPVEEGEERTVDIEDTGDQGDGLARVERGFVVIIPDAEEGERVRIEITDVQENVAFADVIERLSYYE